MRRNSSTVVVLVGPASGEVLSAVSRSMNVALIRSQAVAGYDGLDAAAEALQRAGRATSPYALVPADPLAELAASWQAMWGVSRPQGPAEFEQEAVKALAAWRAGRFELPDYYLALAEDRSAQDRSAQGRSAQDRSAQDRSAQDRSVHHNGGDDDGPDFYLGPLRSVRPHRVTFVAAAEPAQQAAGVLHALGSLRHGRWWPGLDDVIETARGFYPGSLAEANAATATGR